MVMSRYTVSAANRNKPTIKPRNSQKRIAPPNDLVTLVLIFLTFEVLLLRPRLPALLELFFLVDLSVFLLGIRYKTALLLAELSKHYSSTSQALSQHNLMLQDAIVYRF